VASWIDRDGASFRCAQRLQLRWREVVRRRPESPTVNRIRPPLSFAAELFHLAAPQDELIGSRSSSWTVINRLTVPRLPAHKQVSVRRGSS
jgi:hypothetical protein